MWLIEIHTLYKGVGISGKLLAYVGDDSIKAGFDEFVVFETKTALFLYYQRKYGAKPIDGRRLYFDREATETLIKKYLGEEYDE